MDGWMDGGREGGRGWREGGMYEWMEGGREGRPAFPCSTSLISDHTHTPFSLTHARSAHTCTYAHTHAHTHTRTHPHLRRETAMGVREEGARRGLG